MERVGADLLYYYRGAGTSKGSTSWQGKAELVDYVSFIGLVVHYIEGLRSGDASRNGTGGFEPTLSPIQTHDGIYTDAPAAPVEGVTLILGGYSYGSLIATHLPAIDDILTRFANVVKGTAEAEIRLRAHSLSAQWKKDAQLYNEAVRGRSRNGDKLSASARSMALAMGGEESEPGSRRTSRESRRSMDAVRRSMDRSRKKLGFRQHSSETSEHDMVLETLVPVEISTPRTCFLLISPILPPISTFATFFSHLRSGHQPGGEDRLVENQSLVVYGDRDFFTSQKKIRKWVEGLVGRAGSRLRFHEVAGAGHFWRENGAEDEMRRTVAEWLGYLVDDHRLG